MSNHHGEKEEVVELETLMLPCHVGEKKEEVKEDKDFHPHQMTWNGPLTSKHLKGWMHQCHIASIISYHEEASSITLRAQGLA